MQAIRRTRLREERGMTLTELMVSLSVMAVLFALAVPTIQFQIARQELRGAAREVVETLRGTRDAAINEGVPRYVLFTPGDPATLRVYRFNGTAWVPGRNAAPLDTSVTFTADDITFPAMSGVPVTGADVPADAAYFGTRGRYPQGYGGTQSITLRGRLGRSITLDFYPQTGQVTNP
jgi:prepilin-type N-terminal cleavage/methylation domain-containing protein